MKITKEDYEEILSLLAFKTQLKEQMQRRSKMIKTTITREYKDGELIKEVEVSEDDNTYAPTYPVYPFVPQCPTIKPWWEQPFTVCSK